MKFFLSLLFSLSLCISSFSQNGVYLYGFMENAPANPVQVDVSIFCSDSSMTQAVLFTEPAGSIITQWVDLPSQCEIQFIQTGFSNCANNYISQIWNANEFDNLIDIPINLNYCADTMIYGCTDSTAINYNPQATFDNGSCQYNTTCDFNEVTVIVNTQSWGDEVSWKITLDSTYIASGGNYQSNNTYSSNWCLANGCYTFQMFDAYGDGWNGATFQILIDGVVIQSGTLTSGYNGDIIFGINQEGCPSTPPVSGCTDPLALNYNPFAIVDDGSCTYPTPAENDLCADAIQLIPGETILVDNTQTSQNEGIWGECWGFGQGEGEQTSVWYSFTTPNYPATIHLEALYDGSNTLTDTQFGIFENCGDSMIYCDGNSGEGLMSALTFECGDLAENSTYLLLIDGWNGDLGTCFLQFEVDSACTPVVSGCTDPSAINYNPLATVNDGSCQYEFECDLNEIQIVINTQSWAGEIQWQLLSADSFYVAGGNGYDDNMVSTSLWCVADGCYSFYMYDSYGDGWNGATYEVILNNEILASGTLTYGYSGIVQFGINQDCDGTPIVYGCTDPQALNYNPAATVDDGSCQYTNCTEVMIQLDNNGQPAVWSLSSSSYSSAGYYPGSDYQIFECLEDGCYTFQLDSNVTDVYFNVFVDNQIIAQDVLGSFDVAEFQIGSGCDSTSVIFGCTDSTATNYNPDANFDDGSCIYEFACSIDFIVVPDSSGQDIIWIYPTYTILNAVEVLWDFGDGTTSTDLFPSHDYVGDGPFTLCLTATFESPDSSSCTITYCAVLSGDMVGGSGFMESEDGFTINVMGEGTSVGLTTPEPVSNLSLWPNPSIDQLNIQFNSLNSTVQSLEIMDITGKIIIQKQLNTHGGQVSETIDVSSLNSGVYLFKISSANQVETKRFVVSK